MDRFSENKGLEQLILGPFWTVLDRPARVHIHYLQRAEASALHEQN